MQSLISVIFFKNALPGSGIEIRVVLSISPSGGTHHPDGINTTITVVKEELVEVEWIKIMRGERTLLKPQRHSRLP
jgi:hypothetical protein